MSDLCLTQLLYFCLILFFFHRNPQKIEQASAALPANDGKEDVIQSGQMNHKMQSAQAEIALESEEDVALESEEDIAVKAAAAAKVETAAAVEVKARVIATTEAILTVY